ncbi:MAG TPA: LacI family DNA-binding transcriptional regulator [Lachnospiraceae bacterium]|nr:LacI family DNA-binding transcriptional regulator [Lachnospiraceae bacterium]
MEERRVTIKDIADQLGLSTATVSNVIHGKTKKISDTTVSKVQEKLQESGYIPNMAAVLLAQNTSRIVCVVLSDDVKYEHRMIQDPFVSGILNGLSKELSKRGYFMMLKEEPDIDNITKYASMWNMAGLILIGFCEIDYSQLRSRMHIPLVIVDAYVKNVSNYSDVGIDNIDGGYQAGMYLVENGHRRIMFISDNDEDCDHDRCVGLQKALEENHITWTEKDFKLLSVEKVKRYIDYSNIRTQIKDYTAAFCASDVYAIEFMNYLQDAGIRIPEDFSIIGFDNIPLSECIRPRLTTVEQNIGVRARVAVELLDELIEGNGQARAVLLPVSLVKRESVRNI